MSERERERIREHYVAQLAESIKISELRATTPNVGCDAWDFVEIEWHELLALLEVVEAAGSIKALRRGYRTMAPGAPYNRLAAALDRFDFGDKVSV